MRLSHSHGAPSFVLKPLEYKAYVVIFNTNDLCPSLRNVFSSDLLIIQSSSAFHQQYYDTTATPLKYVIASSLSIHHRHRNTTSSNVRSFTRSTIFICTYSLRFPLNSARLAYAFNIRWIFITKHLLIHT